MTKKNIEIRIFKKKIDTVFKPLKEEKHNQFKKTLFKKSSGKKNT